MVMYDSDFIHVAHFLLAKYMVLQHTWFPLIKETLESLNLGKLNHIGMIYMYYLLYLGKE